LRAITLEDDDQPTGAGTRLARLESPELTHNVL
jgi:hypothetical protein